ncbi:MAG TPA: tyrosine-type recombinase/integrase [Oculatellaceae cyanobacterium]
MQEPIPLITLQLAIDDYLATRDLKRSTVVGYRKSLNRCLKDWLEIPINAITPTMIDNRHRELSTSGIRGPGRANANLVMRVLKAVINHGHHKFGDGRPYINPVARLAWNRVPRRQGMILPEEMPDWFAAVLACENGTLRDYLLLLLFTGLRRSEASNLKWGDIDFQKQTLTVRETKNRETLVLPLTAVTREILERRFINANEENPYVFHGKFLNTKIDRCERSFEKLQQRFGRPFIFHDLRRTFITTGESLDMAPYTLKQLVNHRGGNDVTFGYVISSPARLRAPLEEINIAILKQAGLG